MKKGTIVVALILVYLFGASWTIHAETDDNRTVAESFMEQTEETETPQLRERENVTFYEEKNPFFMLLQLVFALLFVIALIYLFLRFMSKRSLSYRSTLALQNLGGVSLGANRSVQLVKVGERLLVVGVGETIQLLKEIDDPDEIERLLKQQEERFEKFEQPFVAYVKRVFKEREKETTSFQDVLKTQLNDVKTSQQKLREVIRERDN